ncbi:MAG: hypothetical protein LUP94_00150, partial [Candidatus Methanomethylicus sp.]|nr:hypothetical protein [Candidatus Methanomethylicus sp.]
MPVPPVESTVKLALDNYNARFSKEVPASLESLRGRIIRVRFGGNILHSCCALDYFDDLSIALEEVLGAPHTVVQYAIITKENPHYSVEIASLDFLGEIERVMEEIGDQVLARMTEFKKAGSEEASLFSELCYCILTANYTAEGGMRIQKEMQGDFNNL